MRPLLLDDSLPGSLAAELERRGRPAGTVAELGLAGASDAAVLDAAARAGAVLVTAVAPRAEGGPAVAVVTGRDEAARREAVHRHAHSMAAQRPGSLRRYPR